MAFGDILASGGGGGATASWTAPGTRSLILLNFSQGDGSVGITTPPSSAVEIDSETAAVTSGYWVGYLIDEDGTSTGESITWAAEDGDEGYAYLIVDIGTSTLTTPVPSVFGGDLTGTVSGVNAAITPAAATNILAAFLHTDAGNQWDSAEPGTAAGDHDGSAGAAALVDSTASWTTNELVGLTLQNITDASSGTITANTSTGITATLSGGTANNWQVGDVYLVSGPFTQPAGAAMRNDADSGSAIAIAVNRPVAQQRGAFARTGAAADQAGIILADLSFTGATATAGLLKNGLTQSPLIGGGLIS